MSTPRTALSPFPPSLHDLAAMAALLERLEQGERPASHAASAGQYRDVVRQVSRLLTEAEPGPALDALLAAAPATAELYENFRYSAAGLCRSPLEASLNAELAAREAIARGPARA